MESPYPGAACSSKLTVQHLNHRVSAPISDATLRRRSLAIDASRSNAAADKQRTALPRSFSALDITSPSVQSVQVAPEPASCPQAQPYPVDDDDDFDSNPLYLHLSEEPQHANDWNVASLALIPLARKLATHHAIHQDDLEDPHFVALHALAPSKLYQHQFVGVRSLYQRDPGLDRATQPGQYDWSHVSITATIESDQKSVSITETTHSSLASLNADAVPDGSAVVPPTITVKRIVAIVAETTIYRTLPLTTQPTSASAQTGFEVTSRAQASNAPTHSTKVRVISVDEPIVHRRIAGADASVSPTAELKEELHLGESQHDEDDDNKLSISELIHQHVPSKRLFAADLSLLAQPSVESPLLAEALTNAFQVLTAAAQQFTASFVYVKGFDSYNAHRIRRGIWFKAWKAFEERLGSDQIARLSVQAFHRIKSLLENAVMGLVHTKMYGPIQDQFLDADLVTDEVLSTYNALNVSLTDFEVENTVLIQRPARLTAAIDTLSYGLEDDDGPEADNALTTDEISMSIVELRRLEPSIPSSTPRAQDDSIRTEWGLSTPAVQRTADTIYPDNLRRRTPIQILQALRATIDEIGWAAERLHPSSSRGASSTTERPPPLATDDLLPVLSYVFVRARPSRLCSMLYYARTFQLTDTATSPELQWALVTCDAVITYLRSDPLQLCRRRSNSSNFAADPSRNGSETQPGFTGISDALSVRSISARSHRASTTASSIQTDTLMARSSSAHGSASAANADAPLSPHSPPLLDPSSDHHSASGSNSGFFRQSDISLEFVAYATSEASPRLQAEGFKLPGLPASVSSRRNSRVLQQRPISVFSLSEDGDAISLLQDTSLDVVDRRPSLAAAQSPSRRAGMRDRTYSSSSSSNTHNDVQIRPQIVRTIKWSQTGNIYTSNRLERTSSNGSTASSSLIHVRVVGSPSMRPMESNLDRIPPIANASPSKSDRRRSFDSWTAFSLFSSKAASSSTDASSEGLSEGMADVSGLTAARKSGGIRRASGELDRAAFSSVASSEPVKSTASRPSPKPGLSAASRHDSASTGQSRAVSASDNSAASGANTIGPEAEDVNCQPEGVETPRPVSEKPLVHRASSVRSTSSRTSASDLGSVKWPASEAPPPSLPGSSRSSQRRYRGRFLSTSSATLAVSAAPLPPQVDRTAMSTANLTRPQRTPRQTIGSLNALRATMKDGGAMATPLAVTRRKSLTHDDVPEMIPYGVDARQIRVTKETQGISTTGGEGREALAEIDTTNEAVTPTPTTFALKSTLRPEQEGGESSSLKVAGDP